MEETQHLHVRDFGPIQSCDIEVQRLTVLTGPQASGKSTLAKLIYFSSWHSSTSSHSRYPLFRQTSGFDQYSYVRLVM